MQRALSDWQAALPDSTPLSAVAMPGTHDTTAYQFAGICPQGRLLDRYPMPVMEWLRKHIKFVGSAVADWTLTQALNVTQQLEQGIRVFDMRLSIAVDRTLVYAHTFVTAEVQGILDAIRKFLDVHRTEIVVLRTQVDWAARAHVTDAVWRLYEYMIRESFDGMLADDPAGTAPTVGDCRARGHQLFVVNKWSQSDLSWTDAVLLPLPANISRSPSEAVVREDLRNRVLHPWRYTGKTLRTWQPPADEQLEDWLRAHPTVDPKTVTVWWMDFPTRSVVTRIVNFNYPCE